MKSHNEKLAGWAGIGLVLLAVALLYWPGMGGGFAFDDISNLVNNPALHVKSLHPDDWMAAIFSSPASSLQRPLAMATFAINHFFTGMDPSAMKLTNLAIHLLNTLLVFQLVRTLFPFLGVRDGRTWTALFVAFAWAVHPINLMAVLYVVQRMESLSHSFVLLGLCLYATLRIRQIAQEGGWWKLAGSLVACSSLGLAAKESAVLLPLYAFSLEVLVFRFRGADTFASRRLWTMYLVLLLIPALAALALIAPQVLPPESWHARNFTLGTRLLTELRVLVDYLHWSVLPDIDSLSLYHDDYEVSRTLLDPPSTLLSGLTLAALAWGAWRVRLLRPLTSLGIFWFFSAHLMTATIIPLELVFEHRNYFASLGICIALGDILLIWPQGRMRPTGAAAAALLLGLFCLQTGLRANEWSTPLRFAMTEAKKHPQSPRAAYDLARILVTMSEYRGDSRYYEPAVKAVEHARRVSGGSLLPAQAALILAARTGKPLKQEWWDEVDAALKTRAPGPEQIGALAALAQCASIRLCGFPPEDMLSAFSAALTHGDHPEVLNIYGDYALNSLGDVPLALRLWQEAARLQPREPQYAINLAKLYIAMGQLPEARNEIARLRKLGRMGQNESAARQLEVRVVAAAAAPTPPPSP